MKDQLFEANDEIAKLSHQVEKAREGEANQLL